MRAAMFLPLAEAGDHTHTLMLAGAPQREGDR
jgi:hypothetical protein